MKRTRSSFWIGRFWKTIIKKFSGLGSTVGIPSDQLARHRKHARRGKDIVIPKLFRFF